MAKAAKETPLMKQYNRIKAKYPDALLLFRVGDFYETFGADAVKAAGILGIILTKRGAGSASEIELAGFPHHSLNTYLPKLVKAGCRGVSFILKSRGGFMEVLGIHVEEEQGVS